MTNKKRIATYTEAETIKKFKTISAIKDKSMSENLETLIIKEIENYEKENGTINIRGEGTR